MSSEAHASKATPVPTPGLDHTAEQAPLETASRPIIVPTASLQPHPLSLALYGDEPADPDLVESIRTRGILEPLAILADGRIVSGHRRWRAATAIALAQVPARLVAFASQLDEQAAVIEHNRQRVKTFSQRMREADKLEAIERERARERQRLHGGTAPGKAADTGGKVAASEPGETRQKVAAAVGMKARSFDKLRTVYKAAQAGSEAALQVMAQLDAGATTINTAFQAVRLEEAHRCGTSGRIDPDLAPAPADPAVSKLGDLWLLGNHRLLCGDSTDPGQVRHLMAGERAVLAATDSPYIVGYTGGDHPQSWSNRAAVKDKDWSVDYREGEVGSAQQFFASFIAVALAEATTEDAAFYLWHASLRQPELAEALRSCGLLVHQQIIWVKSRPVLTHSHYMWAHEPCLYCWRQGHPPARRPPAGERTVWEVPNVIEDGASGLHPTAKPIQLWRRPIVYHTEPGELIYEPFSGSGTAIIAAEMTDRRCRAVELSPPFVDVALTRWQAFTGKDATLEGDGRSFAAVAADRAGTTTTCPQRGGRSPPPSLRSPGTSNGLCRAGTPHRPDRQTPASIASGGSS